MSPVRLIAMLCAAQVLVQIGAFFWPALLPEMIARWRLTNSEAGWITAAFYGAYMLAVPDPRHAHRSHRRQARLSRWRRRDDPRARSVRCARGWLLVRVHRARADRHRLGRNVHDRPQAACRQGGRQNTVPRSGGARREHRRFRCPVLRVRRLAGQRGRLAVCVCRRLCKRGGRVADRRARGAAP